MTTPRINYYVRDFDSIRTSLDAYIAATGAEFWTDFTESNIGVVLINSVAYVGDVLSFSIDRAVEEVFPSTARRRSSVLRFGRSIGYKDRGVSSASVRAYVPNVDLPVQIESYSITIFKNTTISVGGVSFETVNDYIFSPVNRSTLSSDPYIEFDLVEGTSYEESFTATGLPWSTFTFGNTNVVNESWEVRVNGILWTEVSNLLEAQLEDVYQVDYVENVGVRITFGDGIYGNIPEDGIDIAVKYRTSQGTAGNIEPGAVDTYMSATFNITNTVRLHVINDERASGGRDADTLDFLKRYIPEWLKTQNRAVSVSDYETLAELYTSSTYGSIAKAKAKLRYSGYGFNIAEIADSSNLLSGASTDVDTLGAGDGSTRTFTGDLTLAASSPALQITTPTGLPNAFEGVPYEVQLNNRGGIIPYDWDMITLHYNEDIGTGDGGTQIFDTALPPGPGHLITPANLPILSGTVSIVTRDTLGGLVEIVDSNDGTNNLYVGVNTVGSIDRTTGAIILNYSSVPGNPTPGNNEDITIHYQAGILPTGLYLDSITGIISGTPVTGSAGSYTLVLRLTDSDDPPAYVQQTFTMVVSAVSALTILTTSLLDGTVGSAYSTQLEAYGGTAPYTWAITAGTLPAGLSLNAATGAISGIPSVPGTSNITVQVTDAVPVSVVQNLSISITATDDIIFPGSLRVVTGMNMYAYVEATDYPRSDDFQYGDIRPNPVPYAETVATGDGSTQAFSFTLTYTPIQEGSVSISTVDIGNNRVVINDLNDGTNNLYVGATVVGTIDRNNGNVSIDYNLVAATPANTQPIVAYYQIEYTSIIGWINYGTGEIEITFQQAPLAGSNIYVHFHRFSASSTAIASGAIVFIRDTLDDVGNAGVFRWNGELWEVLMMVGDVGATFPVNVVDLYVWSTDSDGYYTATGIALKEAIQRYLHTYGIITVQVEVTDGDIVPVSFNLGDVIVDRNYDADTVRENIDSALRDVFEDADFRPGSPLLLGRVHEAVQSVDGVMNYNLLQPSADLDADESQILTYGRVYDNKTGAVVMDDGVGTLYIETQLPWYTINANTFTIEIKRGGTTIVTFVDDGEGALVDSSGTEIAVSFLDYKTGVLNITFAGTTTVLETDEVYVDYRYSFFGEFQYGDLDLLDELYGSSMDV